MTVAQTDKIDIIGVDKRSGEVILTIIDSMSWDEKTHVQLLQDKLNAYLSFIESGEIAEAYPDSRGKNLRIRLALLYLPNDAARSFLDGVRELLTHNGYAFEVTVKEKDGKDTRA